MGKLFDKIKKEYASLKKMEELQNKDYLKNTHYDNLFKAYHDVTYVNFMIEEINRSPSKYFGSEQNYQDFLNNNKDLFPGNTQSIPTTSNNFGRIKATHYDFEGIFNAIEKTIGDKKVEELLEHQNNYENEKGISITHPFDSLIKTMVNDLKDLNLNEEDLKKYTDDLNYINNELVEKHGDDQVDKVIDGLSYKRDVEAAKNVKEVGISHGVDADKFQALKDNQITITFIPNTSEDKEFLKPFTNIEPKISEEYKNKILALDKLIEEKGLIPNGLVGESSYKEYGFTDYFNKVEEVKQLVCEHKKLTDPDEKKAKLEQIHEKTNELKEVNKKYDDVINFIKDNFDLNKVDVPANVYSGRVFKFNSHETFMQNLPEKWDKENAPYGVILNGFAQLKGAAKQAGVTVEEYLNNPVKSFLKGAKNEFKKEDDLYIMPRGENNSLGKRIAHIAVMNDNPYMQTTLTYSKSIRGIEFINNTSDLDKNTLDNIVTSAAGAGFYVMYNHSPDYMFNNNRQIDYDSIENLFILGNETDNLFEVSKNYCDDNVSIGEFAKTSGDKLQSFKNKYPLNETRRVMETLKEYMLERKVMYDERANDMTNDNDLADALPPKDLFMGARKYVQDFIYKNDINLLALDKKARKEVFAFLNDPVSAFEKKYRNVDNLFLKKNNGELKENFSTIAQEFKQDFAKLNKKAGDDFVAAFNDLNNKTAGRNQNKNIAQILNDNKGGFWEKRFGRTSKEYKALEASLLVATNPNSPTYGDLTGAKVYAEKYLIHKLPAGTNFDRLSENEKRRIELCQTVIGTANKLDMEKEVKDEKIILADDNLEFQNQLQKDVDLGLENNNNIIYSDMELDKNIEVAQQ